MAKKSMNIRYKEAKRVRKNNKTVSKEKELKSNIISAICIVGFIFLVYLGLLGLEKLGLFEAGYVKPSTNVEISDTNIMIGEVFNRRESEYLVLFDKFGNKYEYNMYIENLAKEYISRNDDNTKIYFVDMYNKYNEKYISDEANYHAKNVSELKINDITLIKISNGEIKEYIVGSDDIESYLNND